MAIVDWNGRRFRVEEKNMIKEPPKGVNAKRRRNV